MLLVNVRAREKSLSGLVAQMLYVYNIAKGNLFVNTRGELKTIPVQMRVKTSDAMYGSTF
jgi:hypothetical protein